MSRLTIRGMGRHMAQCLKEGTIGDYFITNKPVSLMKWPWHQHPSVAQSFFLDQGWDNGSLFYMWLWRISVQLDSSADEDDGIVYDLVEDVNGAFDYLKASRAQGGRALFKGALFDRCSVFVHDADERIQGVSFYTRLYF